jgi:hypothetical protein
MPSRRTTANNIMVLVGADHLFLFRELLAMFTESLSKIPTLLTQKL